jgi:hypothetical protein
MQSAAHRARIQREENASLDDLIGELLKTHRRFETERLLDHPPAKLRSNKKPYQAPRQQILRPFVAVDMPNLS